MKKSGLISVIVPIYGVEKYLEECIESIIGQTYTNLEVILVDDGSPDRCGEICDRYAKMDSRITVIHQKNGGAAAARNAGLRIAAGECIAFVDGDDYLEADAYEKMMKALLAHNADIVHAKMRYIYVNGIKAHEGGEEIASFTTAEYLLHFWEEWTCALSTIKLFRRHTLADVYYEEGHWIDDEFFTYRGVLKAEKILCIPDVVYNYRQRASSVMKNRDTTEGKSQDILDFLEKRNRDVIGRFPELETQYNNYYVDYLLYLVTMEMGTEKTVREIKKRLFRLAASGKVLPWRKGQRKRWLRMLSFLVLPGKAGADRKGDVTQSGYQFFE